MASRLVLSLRPEQSLIRCKQNPTGFEFQISTPWRLTLLLHMRKRGRLAHALSLDEEQP